MPLKEVFLPYPEEHSCLSVKYTTFIQSSSELCELLKRPGYPEPSPLLSTAIVRRPGEPLRIYFASCDRHQSLKSALELEIGHIEDEDWKFGHLSVNSDGKVTNLVFGRLPGNGREEVEQRIKSVLHAVNPDLMEQRQVFVSLASILVYCYYPYLDELHLRKEKFWETH